MIAVKNVSRSRGPIAIDGGGMLAHGDTGKAADTEHTVALIDAGHLLPLKPAKQSGNHGNLIQVSTDA